MNSTITQEQQAQLNRLNALLKTANSLFIEKQNRPDYPRKRAINELTTTYKAILEVLVSIK